MEKEMYKALPVLTPHPDPLPHGEKELIGKKLSMTTGKNYWRSLDELADTPEFRTFLEQEFPSKHELWMDPISRRDFLKLMGASMAMMFFSGCRRPLEKIFPYNDQPETIIPGQALFYATAIPVLGYVEGALVETHEGRPTKVEGNPKHPDSLGASDIFMQAAVLELYDPDRSQAVINNGIISSWDNFLHALRVAVEAQKGTQGAGLRVLLEATTSPTLIAQLNELKKQFPKAQWIAYDPLDAGNAAAGAEAAFGQAVETRYDLENADIILALDADFMGAMPGRLRHIRGFTAGRNPDRREGMNRLYVAEPSPTVTGSNADHRLALRASDIEALAREIAGVLGVSVESGTLPAAAKSWAQAVAKDLRAHRGRGAVLVGESQPPAVHALAHAINGALGNAGQTVFYSEPIRIASPHAALKQLVEDMNQNRVDTLLILGGNPVYNAPADLKFADALNHVKLRFRLGLYDDETSNLSHWHVPQAHPLESWGDGRSTDGTIALIQPMIEPLYAGRTAQEILSALLEDSPRLSHDILKDYWKRNAGLNLGGFWKTTLHEGVVADSRAAHKTVTARRVMLPAARPAQTIEIVFKADPSVLDGRYANNGWLQELPKPLTKLTWDNAALMSPATAARLNVSNNKLVTLKLDGRSVDAPVWITPGHADNSVTVYLGYGRTRGGVVAKNHGFNAYTLRTTDVPYFAAGLDVRPTGGHITLASTQIHHSIEGREIVRGATLAEYRKDPRFAFREEDHPKPSDTLYNSPKLDDETAWGMSIDMNLCVGCNACVLGCQSENNISIVGKDQVLRGREMHWIRIDQYFAGDPADPEVTNQPVPCMHCENAPCEPVCPVGATVHSDEGINEMVYNRCIGTRYCSNNCPYKVRRFNFLQYSDITTPTMKMQHNPNVTVRFHGVMEKCTYCIQRVNEAKITADKEDRAVRDGEIKTACQQACPASAIVFGNIADKKSEVARLKAGPRDYPMLGGEGVRPRTTYLAKIRNPNPEL